METGRIHMSAMVERVQDNGNQQIMCAVDGEARGLNMRVARVRESRTRVRDLKDAPCVCRYCAAKRTSRLQKSWSDGLFLGVAD